MFLKPRGSITVFLCIILAVLIPLSCMLIDISRFSLAKKQAKIALKTCAESVLAAYDRQFKEQYGLFAIHPRDIENMEKEIYELLSANLNTEAAVEGFSDLYEFKVLNVKAIPFYNFSEPFVLQQQVAEFMKYRAPVQVVQEFYEKIKVMIDLAKEGDMIERKMSLDKLMNDIRSDLVNIYCMIKDELIKFNHIVETPDTTLKDKSIANASEYVKKAKELIEIANEQVQPVKEAREGYIAIYDDYISAKEKCDDLKYKLDKAHDKLEKKRDELADLKENDSDDDGEDDDDDDDDDKIESLKEEIAKLRDEYNSIKDEYDEARAILDPLEKEILGYKKIIDEGLTKAITNLIDARLSNDVASADIAIFMNHVSNHIMYTSDVIELIDKLTPKLSELEKESESLKKDADDYESGVSDTIKGNLEVQLKSIKVETFTEARSRLTTNLQKLEKWNESINGYYLKLCKASSDFDYVIETANEVKEKPQNNNKDYQGFVGYDSYVSDITVLRGDLSDLKAIDQMKDYYEIPVYDLEPKANSNEIKAFKKWFNAKYLGIEDSKEEPDDDGSLDEVRDGIGEFAQEAAEPEDDSDLLDGINGNLENLIERYMNLPSIKGATSSEEALIQIGRAILESSENNIINENPFEQPAQGLDTVNEKEKNFFDFELERIKELFETIKSLIANGAENLIESLYMNEYIVSAFKCATSIEGIEHDIDWGRPLDKTFMKQAEVEYILFGNKFEKENIVCVKRSIFAIRLLFNLLHVYTDPDKVATALSLATAIAGWTIFGIPIVQNFILIAWAGVESYVDTDYLLKGKSVPLIKTSASWYLGADNAISKLKEILTKDFKKLVTDVIENKVEQVSEAVQETVTGIINGIIDKTFAPIESGLTDLTGEPTGSVDSDMEALLERTINEFISGITFDDLNSFKKNFESAVSNLVSGISENLKAYVPEKLAQFKNRLKEKIRKFIFESDTYREMEEKLVELGTDLLDKGIDAAEDQLDKILGAAGESGRNNITGRLIMMDYVDYLRLMLLAVPAETKALRTADLMQLNMQEVAEDYNISMDQYKTYIFIKAELDFNSWFLPEWIFKNGDSGMISVEWSQGY